MATRRTLKKSGYCMVMKTVKNGRISFKCKGMKRPPKAQEIIDSIR